MLTDSQLKARDGKLTASRVACLMTGDKDKMLNLWRELGGDPAFVPDDLSDIWAVRLGEITEQLNLDWYSEHNAEITCRGDVVVAEAPDDWAAATLDGWCVNLSCPIECKHVGGFEKFEAIVERYMPQMHWQMLVTQSNQCVLSVIEGAREPRIEIVKYNVDYGKELWRRAEKFMECVRSLTPPVDMPPVAAPVTPTKEYNMTGNNLWASAAADWLEHRLAAKQFESAKDAIKSLVPPDAVVAHGHQVRAKRSKTGSLTIVENRE